MLKKRRLRIPMRCSQYPTKIKMSNQAIKCHCENFSKEIGKVAAIVFELSTLGVKKDYPFFVSRKIFLL